MKTELVDVNATRKNLRVEIPRDVVDGEIDRLTHDYSRRARLPGFRPGKAPTRLVRQRFREQILQDVAQALVPRAVDEALRERGVEAVATPDVQDVVVEEGAPLTFTASFDTVPSFDPGDYTGLSVRRPAGRVEEEAVDQALEQLRQRAARSEPVTGRPVAKDDIVTLDLERSTEVGEGTAAGPERGDGVPAKGVRGVGAAAGPERGDGVPAKGVRGVGAPGVKKDAHRDVNVELGAKANPPGFDEQLLGLEVGAEKTFTIHYPADYAVKEMADRDVTYAVTVKGIKQRVVPALDDEFAKDLGEFGSLADLRAKVREDLEHTARHDAEREMRGELMKQLAARVPFEVPASLVEREIDRRLEDFAQRLIAQQIDPRQAGIDWQAFRESQRASATEAVAGALVLDEVARREQMNPSAEEVDREIARHAERTGRTAPAVRAALEKEGGLSRVSAGLRREKSIDFLLSRATISTE